MNKKQTIDLLTQKHQLINHFSLREILFWHFRRRKLRDWTKLTRLLVIQMLQDHSLEWLTLGTILISLHKKCWLRLVKQLISLIFRLR
jgi:hypothetical protein